MGRGQRMLLLLFNLFALLVCAHSQCEEGWRPYEGRCYHFSEDKKTWMQAHAECLRQDSDLMSIQDIHERLWVKTQIAREIFWIGLNDRMVEGVWEWTDGNTFYEYIAHWMTGQPDNWGGDPGEDCGQVVGLADGEWNDENCDVPRKYICKRQNPNPPTQCANGWRPFNSNCYKLKADTMKSWVAARFDCLREGGDLVSITSDEEEQYVTETLDTSQIDLWIGLSTLKCNKLSCQVEAGNDQFTWSDADPGTYRNWGQGEPTVDAQAGTCSAIIKNEGEQHGKWRTHACRHERPYMCKRQLNTVCPPGWLSFSGSCYWLVSNTELLTNWYEAQTKCTDLGANLLIINSQEEQYFINGRLPDFHHSDIPDIWIGLSDKNGDGVFQWVDKTDISFSNWGSGWPQNTADVWDCGQIFAGNYEGKWETTGCFKSLGYICEMTGGQNVKPTSPPKSYCDQGYLLFGNYCYHFELDNLKNFEDAENYCVSEEGHLVSFQTQEELSFLTAHMPRTAWVGLNDRKDEGHFEFTDGSQVGFLLWEPGQPDDYQGNEDCVHLRGMNHHEAGKLNDDDCSSTYEFICKKEKGKETTPQPPTSGPGWTEKCGYWTPDPFNDYCYLFNYLSMRKWAEARADCVNQGGDLISITDPFEQGFIHGLIHHSPTGISLWMGGHDSVTEGGWEWTDGSPFRYIRWNAGNPDNYNGEDCLSILINNGYWNDDNCEVNRGYICKRRGKTPPPPPPHDGFMTALMCQDSSAVLHCPGESVINIQSAFYGRKKDDICPHLDGSGGGNCTVPGVLPFVRKVCDNRPFCFAYAHVEHDPCPEVSKYLEIIYSCEQKVCLHGLGVESGSIADSQLSASSSLGAFTPNKARLNGNSCWRPSSGSNSNWIQVDLGQTRKVTGIVIQGCPQNDYWVTKFKVKHSMDGTSWTDYTVDGEFFPGSVDGTTAETQLLGSPISAKYIKILPLEYNGQVGLRFDILGCTPEYAVTCAKKPNFTNSIDTMTVHCPAGCAKAAYEVFGTSVYRGDSNICAAAIHAGVILNEAGGDCTLLKAAGQDFYPGSSRHGITSRQSSSNYPVSYTFADGELRCSGNDWHEFGESCYKPFEDKKTWFNAQIACRSQGAELVSILSMTEQSWIESYLYMATSDVWIGLNDQQVSGMFIWSDKHWVSFTYWAPGEPNNHEGFGEDCVKMYHETGRWNDVSCSELNTYICKMPKGHYPLPSVKPTVYGCPAGWDAYGYSCYWMEETARTWSDAKAFCLEQDGFMLHIGDIYEQSHFTVMLSGKTGFWWTGLRAQGHGVGGVQYVWDNGYPVTFTHWARDQPDDGDGTCIAMSTETPGGFWDDKPCSEKFFFICERQRPDISPPTLPPTPPPSIRCAEGWSAEPQHRNCYKLFHNVDYSQKKSWAGALADCVSRGANLVSIHSQAEEAFLSFYSRDSSKWIGLKHNPIEGGYSWSDGTPVSHTNWGLGEPNNHDDREDCVEMVSNHNGTISWWNDLNCDAHQDWICMIAMGKTPIVPTAPPSPAPAPDCGSNPGWRKKDDICYYYNDTDIVDFHKARERCYAEKATLVSILNEEEQAFVNSMVGTGRIDAAWIGMRMFGLTGGQYVWVDLSPVAYTHWAPGEPNNANGEEQCVQMNRHQGVWNDANCGRGGAGYVCKKRPGEHHTAPPPTEAWEGNCPAGWMLFKNKCFMFKGHKDGIKANWSTARSWCSNEGGELAVIDNQYENDFVSSYLRDLQLPTWIGLSDILEENEYAWSDGVSPVLYTNWNTNEPNNVGGVEHCVAMTHNYLVSGKWNDEACHEERSFVCYRMKASDIKPPPTTNPCKNGYISWYKNCYKLVEKPATWEAAQKTCEQEGGNLASIDMSYDQAFVAGVVLQGRADAWIGLRRKENSNSYKWTDGWPVFFTHWGPGEPSNHTGEGCVSMHGAPFFHGTWNDTWCDAPKPFICKISTENPPPTPPPGDGHCVEGWKPYGHFCYLAYGGPKSFSWPESHHICQSLNAELASVHSRAEVEFIRNLNYTKNHPIWIGLTRDGNFGWSWTDKTALGFVNWAPGEPNDAFHPGEVLEENCVEMSSDGLWNDNDCLQNRGFACRSRQHHTTGGGVIPPNPIVNHGAVIAGAIIGAIVLFTLIFGLLYYLFSVRGIKLNLPTRRASVGDVPAFSNPNFGGESET